MSVRVGVSLAAPAGEPAAAFWRLIDRCEADGIDSVWLSDRLVGAAGGIEPMIALAAIAGRTRKLKLGPSVLILPQRQPVVLAKEAATLDFLSNGRFLLAVGVGLDDPRDWQATGVPKSERGARLDESMTLMRRLWSEDDVTFHGRFFHCEGVTIRPRPKQSPLPIWVGGRSDAALRRTVQFADGWLPSFITIEEFAAGKAAMKLLETEIGRTLDDDHYGTFIVYGIADSRSEAETLSKAALRPGSRPGATTVADYYVFGSADDVADRVNQYVEAGASKFVLRPAGPADSIEDQLSRLARDVVPQVER